MKINSVNQNFGAMILSSKGSADVSKMLDVASMHDYSLSNFTDYRDLCNRINEILPEKDVVYFKKANGLLDDKMSYVVDGSIAHDGKTIPFTVVTYCINGSFAVGKRIIDSIKNTIKKERTSHENKFN